MWRRFPACSTPPPGTASTGRGGLLRLDTCCRKSPDYFRRLEQVKQACDEQDRADPGRILRRLRQRGAGARPEPGGGLAGGRRRLRVKGGEARLVPDESVRLANAVSTTSPGNSAADGLSRPAGPDQLCRHGREARAARFLAPGELHRQSHGHGRVMQEIKVKPTGVIGSAFGSRPTRLRRGCLSGAGAVGETRAGAAPVQAPRTTDWRKLTMVFQQPGLRIGPPLRGVWGGRAGKCGSRLAVEEVGPINVLRRPGTPVTIRSGDGSSRSWKAGTMRP